MALATTWFIIIAVLWAGFFALEGFDLGVGMLHGLVAHDESGRRAAIGTIAPVWDGNEVWLVVAGAGMFAAFPNWYATMFSGFYLAIVLLLVALIIRGVSFEFREKVNSPRWRTTWDWLLTVGSFLIPLLAGIALGDLLAGVPIDNSHEYAGTFADLFTPYGIFAGITLVLLSLVHGATFLTVKTAGPIHARAARIAAWLAPITTGVVIAFALWTHAIADKGVLPNLLQWVAILSAVAAAWLLVEHSHGWAFVASTVTITTAVLSLFADLYPRLMVSSLGSQFDLTIANSASGGYALKVMTVIAAALLPVVLVYQAWTYHVFRARVRTGDHAASADVATNAAGPVSDQRGS